MQKLPAFPAGAIYPYSAPAKPADWAPSTYRQYGWGQLRQVPMYLVAYESWWLGRNLVSRHYTGKNAHTVGGVPSTIQGTPAPAPAFAPAPAPAPPAAHRLPFPLWCTGYIAVGILYPIMRVGFTHGLQMNKWST
jgi:hypothetical protein